MGYALRFNTLTVVVVIVAALLTKTAGQSSYCSICSDHTLCIYQGTGSACSQVLGRGVDSAAQRTILDEHNQHRNYVASGKETSGAPGPQPAAADMLKLVWDSELASIAQRWSDQCAYGHDACRSVPRFSVGQNACETKTTGSIQGANWKNAVQEWYSEVKDFNNSYVDKYVLGSKWGHYSQVVWGKTHYVGCGYTAYKKSGWSYQYYICNYGPAEKYNGSRVYTRGTCSSCPSGCDSTYPSLCA